MKNSFKKIWAVLNRRERNRFSRLILLDIGVSFIDILSLALLLWIIRFYIQPGENTASFPLPRWLADRNSVTIIAVFFLLFGCKNIAAYFIARKHYSFIGGVAIRISADNLRRYQQSSFEDFVRIDSSVHIRQVALQPFEFCQYMLSGVQQIVTQTCLVSIAITAILQFNPQLFLLLLCILLPPVIVLFYFMKKRMDTARKHIRESNEKSYRYLLDALKGYVESNIYNRNEFFLDRFIRQRREFSRHLFDSISIQNLPPRIIELFAVLGLFILIVIAKWSGGNDTASFVTIGAFMAAAYKIIPGIVKIINAMGQIKAYALSANEGTETGEIDRNHSHNSPPPAIDSIQLKEIDFDYGGNKIIEKFCLQVNKGDFIALLAPSGKGKTTLLNLILGFIKPHGGEIRINERPVQATELREYWPRISYVRQQPFFIHDTILRNITLDEKNNDPENLHLALNLTGLDEFIHHSPDQTEQLIAENGKNISGGQQQRVAIARALYKNTDLILLDEPFNELDEAGVIPMLDHFRELSRQGKMVILITHDRNCLSWCNKIISLDEQ